MSHCQVVLIPDIEEAFLGSYRYRGDGQSFYDAVGIDPRGDRKEV